MFFFQILTGEPQKIKHKKPILGLLQTSKSFLPQKAENKYDKDDAGDNDDQNLFDTLETSLIEDNNAVLNHAADKNPIINKRILLKVNSDVNLDFNPPNSENLNVAQNRDDAKQPLEELKAKLYKSESIGVAEGERDDYEKNSNENNIYDTMKLIKQYPTTVSMSNGENSPNQGAEPKHSNEGRIVVYGDSNCLDSTHIEKPCFWLLDALLEYTMTSHVTSILKGLNHAPHIRFPTNLLNMPKRLPNNNLHMYSKVLLSTSASESLSSTVNDGQARPSSPLKRPIPQCFQMSWNPPIYLNISAPDNFHLLNGRHKDDSDDADTNMVEELIQRRKLESQKGEVRSVDVSNNSY